MQSLLICSEAVPLDIPRFGDERAQQDILAQVVRVRITSRCLVFKDLVSIHVKRFQVDSFAPFFISFWGCIDT